MKDFEDQLEKHIQFINFVEYRSMSYLLSLGHEKEKFNKMDYVSMNDLTIETIIYDTYESDHYMNRDIPYFIFEMTDNDFEKQYINNKYNEIN